MPAVTVLTQRPITGAGTLDASLTAIATEFERLKNVYIHTYIQMIYNAHNVKQND